MEQLTANLLIIIVTVGMSLYAWSNQSVFQGWMMNPAAIERKREYHRFVTSGFIHADYMHLFFNMFTLYNFGTYAEDIFIIKFDNDPKLGSVAYVVFYIVAIIASDISTFIKHRNDSNYNSLGASGAVSAVMFGVILFYPTQLEIWRLPAFIYAGLYLTFTYYEMRRGNGYINHSAHWWGAVFGIVIMVVMYPQVLPQFIEQIRNWRPF
jgi:membrane associated rhomboid family serine protease